MTNIKRFNKLERREKGEKGVVERTERKRRESWRGGGDTETTT